jgi:hypothetical protein
MRIDLALAGGHWSEDNSSEIGGAIAHHRSVLPAHPVHRMMGLRTSLSLESLVDLLLQLKACVAIDTSVLQPRIQAVSMNTRLSINITYVRSIVMWLKVMP